MAAALKKSRDRLVGAREDVPKGLGVPDGGHGAGDAQPESRFPVCSH